MRTGSSALSPALPTRFCLLRAVVSAPICGLCRPSATLELPNISTCIDYVARWMRSNRLQLNTAKTEVLWSTSSRRLHLELVSPIRMGIDEVMAVSVVRNLSIYMDADVSMRSHVSKTVAVCLAIVRQLLGIRSALRSTVTGVVSRPADVMALMGFAIRQTQSSAHSRPKLSLPSRGGQGQRHPPSAPLHQCTTPTVT